MLYFNCQFICSLAKRANNFEKNPNARAYKFVFLVNWQFFTAFQQFAKFSKRFIAMAAVIMVCVECKKIVLVPVENAKHSIKDNLFARIRAICKSDILPCDEPLQGKIFEQSK